MISAIRRCDSNEAFESLLSDLFNKSEERFSIPKILSSTIYNYVQKHFQVGKILEQVKPILTEFKNTLNKGDYSKLLEEQQNTEKQQKFESTLNM